MPAKTIYAMMDGTMALGTGSGLRDYWIMKMSGCLEDESHVLVGPF